MVPPSPGQSSAHYPRSGQAAGWDDPNGRVCKVPWYRVRKTLRRRIRYDRFDAMSLAAVSCVYVDGLQEVRFNHFVATGDSATYVTQDKAGYATIREAIFGKEVPLANEGQEKGDRPCD